MVDFYNIPVRQRNVEHDRETRIHKRLSARKEGSSLLESIPQSPGFLSDRDRFHSDTAGEERLVREKARMRVNMQLERRRREAVDRDVRRWDKMNATLVEEKRRIEKLQASGLKARRNKGSEPFNLITLQYNDGKDGERLQAADAVIKHRAMQRAQNLQYQNSREGIHPITGKAIRTIEAKDLFPPSQ